MHENHFDWAAFAAAICIRYVALFGVLTVATWIADNNFTRSLLVTIYVTSTLTQPNNYNK